MTWIGNFIGLILVIGLLGFVIIFHLVLASRTIRSIWYTRPVVGVQGIGGNPLVGGSGGCDARQ